jgi:hypothetical protein
MKILKFLLLAIGISLITFLSYRYLPNIQVTKVSLKCESTDPLFKGINYYKITRNIFDEDVFRLHSSIPNNKTNFNPTINGINISLKLLQKYQLKPFSVSSTDYNFIDVDEKNINESSLNKKSELFINIYRINRESLELKTFLGVDSDAIVLVNTQKCEITTEDKFDNDWNKKVDNIKKKLKI